MINKLEPQDLRYGNLIEFDGKIFTVKEIGRYIVTANRGKGDVDFTYNEINPVPLTEDWLLRAGFNKEYKKGYIGIDAGNSDFVLTEPFKMGEWQEFYTFQFEAGNVPKFKSFKNLNELQNFFYCSYNEELEINMK